MNKLGAVYAVCGVVESLANVYYASRCMDNQRNIVDENRHLNDLLVRERAKVQELSEEVLRLRAEVEAARSLGPMVGWVG